MAPASLNIKLNSCKNLKSFNFFQKFCVYSTISLINQDPKTHKTTQRHQEQKTPVDRDGDSNPEWNHQAQFDLTKLSSLDHVFLEFDLFCEGLVFGIGNKSIGHVRVPIEELIEESRGVLRFGSYQVMSSEEKPDSGVLDFSYKVVDDNPNPSCNLYPWQGYPPPPQEFIYPSPPPPEGYYTAPPQTPHYPPTPPPPEVFYASPPQTPHYPQPPPPEVFYTAPPQTSNYPPPQQEGFYTSPPQTPHYHQPPPPEAYYTSPPQQTPHYPPPQQVYYPPPPVAYPAPVAPYYGEQLRPQQGDAWHNERRAEVGVGFDPWAVR